MANFTGFYPVHNCKRCGSSLGGHDTGSHEFPSYDRPAELYVGTYTGLCYKCQNAGVTILETYPDGSKLKEYPPHAPSWRRDRETYTAFDDCPDCNGKGYIWVSRSDAMGGSYPRYCEACHRRHYAAEYARRDREEAREKRVRRAHEIEKLSRSKDYRGMSPEELQYTPIAVEYRQILREVWSCQ